MTAREADAVPDRGRFDTRTRIGVVVVTLVDYLWRLAELHLRRALPRRRHYLVMRLFRLLGPAFPVVLRYPNPLMTTGTPLALCLDLCQNHEIYVRARGRYEVEWLRLVGGAMGDAERFVDVGANVGAYSLAVAQAFPDREVVAVEPMPDACAKLRQAVAVNGIPNVTVVQGVVADQPGPVSFHPNPLSDGGGSLIPFDAYRTGDVTVDAEEYRRRHPRFTDTLTVDAVPLDALLDRRSVVKVDVEGAEEAVLRSGRRALGKGLVDVMVVEVQRETLAATVRLLDELDFDCFLYGRRRPLRVEDGDLLPYRVGNVLCLRRGSVAHERLDFD
jgi:FkbM family methyltransferase